MVYKLLLWTDFCYNPGPRREKTHLPFADAFPHIWPQTTVSLSKNTTKVYKRSEVNLIFVKEWWCVDFVSLQSEVSEVGWYKGVPFYQRWLLRIWHGCDLIVTFLGRIETKLKNTQKFAKPYRGDVNPLNLVCYLIEIGSIIRNLDDIFLQIIKRLNVQFFSRFRRRNIRTLILKRLQHGRMRWNLSSWCGNNFIFSLHSFVKHFQQKKVTFVSRRSRVK